MGKEKLTEVQVIFGYENGDVCEQRVVFTEPAPKGPGKEETEMLAAIRRIKGGEKKRKIKKGGKKK